MNDSTPPRQMSLVRFNASQLSRDQLAQYPFDPSLTYLYLGELKNMPGHCAVADIRGGGIYAGFHCEHFEEVTEEGYDD